MDSAPEFLNLFVEPTGELIYFLAVIAICQSAMLMALGQRMRGRSETVAGRYTVLLGGIVITWIAMGAGGLYALVTDTPDNAIIPPLERAVNTVVIVLASGALLAADSPHNERRTWRFILLLTLGIIAAYAYTANIWEPLAADKDFNKHPLGFAWTFIPGLLILCAMTLLVTRYKQTADIPLKMLFFVVLLLGYSYTTARISSGDMDGDTSGALRLAFLTAVPILAIIVYRLVLDRLTAAIDEVAEYAEAVSRPQPSIQAAAPPPMVRPNYMPASESMTLLKAVGLMLEKEDPDMIPFQIVTAVATVLKADITALVSHDEARWADVISAYDHIQQRPIPGLALNLEEQPTLLNALERKTQRPLYPDRNTDELVDLYTRLDIAQLGPAYIQPLTRMGQVVAVLIVGLPYTNRELNDTETSLLEGLAPIAARLLSLSRATQRVQADAEDRAIQAIIAGESPDAIDQESVLAARKAMQNSLEVAQQQIAELSRLVRDLQVELDYERSRMAQLLEDGDEALTISQRIGRLSEERQELAAERELLAQALQEAQTALMSATAEDNEDVYSTMIDALQRERDELEVQKAKLERQLDEVRGTKDNAVAQSLHEMLTDLSNDKARLSAERDQMQSELDRVQEQIKTLGFEGGPLAIAKALSQLSEERTYYKTAAEKIAHERDLLLAERKRLESNIRRESEREAQLAALESDLRRLATDREALIKQRDSMRGERDDLLKARDTWMDQRTRLLAEVTGLQAEMEDTSHALNRVNSEKQDWTSERASLEAERDRLLAERTAIQTERDQLLARIEGNRELLQQLGADGVGALKDMIDELTQERQDLEGQLVQTRQELERLEREHSRTSASSSQETHAVAPANADVIMSIAQELRTPMSSIMGYTDLLLSESVGILGALQRQFIQRVQANIDRLSNLVQDLVSISVLDSDEFKLQPATLDMLEVIEDAITGAGNQFKEKNITLHMKLADSLPPLHADRDAMHQVLMQLLSNAYLASPPNGEVTIIAHPIERFTPPVSQDIALVGEAMDGILVTVTDQGGGVPPEERRRVFGRLYRADNPLIEGIGDTGVGLSIARALVEAHHGAIWLESQLGQGSTFNFVIPLAAQHAFAEEA